MVHTVPNKILSEMKQRIALKRLGRAEDVANLALFLASNARSGYITGEVLECSGMLRLWWYCSYKENKYVMNESVYVYLRWLLFDVAASPTYFVDSLWVHSTTTGFRVLIPLQFAVRTEEFELARRSRIYATNNSIHNFHVSSMSFCLLHSTIDLAPTRYGLWKF